VGVGGYKVKGSNEKTEMSKTGVHDVKLTKNPFKKKERKKERKKKRKKHVRAGTMAQMVKAMMKCVQSL
jgi:ribosomal protein L6P/L9E